MPNCQAVERPVVGPLVIGIDNIGAFEKGGDVGQAAVGRIIDDDVVVIPDKAVTQSVGIGQGGQQNKYGQQ